MQRKQEVNTVKENLYGSEIGLCTAVRKLATGKWTQLLADKERVMPGLQHWLNRKAKTMEDAVVAVLEQFSPELVKIIICDCGSEFANWGSTEKCILQIHTVLGKREQMRIQTDYSGSFIPKGVTFPE